MYVAPATFHPNEAWVKEQAEAFLERSRQSGLGTALVMHDRNTKFTQSFDDVLKAGGVKAHKAALCSPNTCAFVERFIQTLQQECLDDFVVFGERHMDYLVSEMLAYYHDERPHQGKENELLIRGLKKPSNRQKASVSTGDIQYQQWLVGLLRHYGRKAA